MIAGKQPLFVLPQECDCIVEETTVSLKMAGYKVVRSFDLHSAISAQCPCSCQLVVLLVYGQDGAPITLIFDSSESGTSVFLIHDPKLSNRSLFVTQLTELLNSGSSLILPALIAQTCQSNEHV